MRAFLLPLNYKSLKLIESIRFCNLTLWEETVLAQVNEVPDSLLRGIARLAPK